MNKFCLCLNRIGTYRVLRRIPACLWIVFLLHCLDAFSYFARTFNITLYFTERLGMSDATASRYYAWFGAASVVFGVLAGPVIDWMGLKKSLLLGILITTVAGFMFAFATSIPVVVMALLFGIPLGAALFQPPLHIAVDRYSVLKAENEDMGEQVKKMAFRFLYTGANLGAVVALVYTSALIVQSGVVMSSQSSESSGANSTTTTANCSDVGFNMFAPAQLEPTSSESEDGWVFDGYGLLFLTAAIVSAVTVVVTSAFQETRMPVEPEKITAKQCISTLREPNFYILLCFVTSLIPVRAMFKYMEALMPIYLTRTLPCAPYGMLLAVNPLAIIVLTPVMGIVTRRVPLFALLIIGTFISGISPLLLAFWTEAPYYTNIWVSILIFTVGEALYSPMVSQYTLMLSPLNKKGLYGGLILLPTFLGTFAAGEITAWLLEDYCPRGGDPARCHEMWIPVALMSLISFVLLVVMYIVLYPVCKFNEEASAQGYTQQLDSELGDAELSDRDDKAE